MIIISDYTLKNALIGSVQLHFVSLTSTNRFAQLLLSKTRPRAGTVISAGFQSAGEGQFGRSWFGSKGTNLCLSLILYPQIPVATQFKLSVFVALALRDTVAYFIDKPVFVKWPNDIIVDDRKISGILIQNSISGHSIQHSIIGIGLNVNETQYPESLPNATSILLQSGKKLDLAEVTSKLLEFLNAWHSRAIDLPWNTMRTQYEQHMYCLGQVCPFYFKENERTLMACIEGVDDSGRLLLAISENKRTEAYTLNQVRQIIV